MLLAVDDRACILLLTGLLVVVLLTVVSGILEGCTVRVVFLKMTCVSQLCLDLQLQTSGSTTVVTDNYTVLAIRGSSVC